MTVCVWGVNSALAKFVKCAAGFEATPAPACSAAAAAATVAAGCVAAAALGRLVVALLRGAGVAFVLILRKHRPNFHGFEHL